MRGVQVGKSARALLAQTVAIFSTKTASQAILPTTISQVNAGYFTALALQNPGQAAASITIELRSASGSLISATSLSLLSGNRIQRELSEWFRGKVSFGSYLRIVSNQPVQMLGLLGNDASGTVIPVPVLI